MTDLDHELDARREANVLDVAPSRTKGRRSAPRYERPLSPAVVAPRSSLGPHAVTVAYAVVGFAGALLISASAPVWRNAAPSWRLTVPGIPHPGSSATAATLFALGMLAMCVGWIGLVGRSERMPGSERTRRNAIVLVLCLWALPPLLATPLLSNDSYSYSAQGEMASRGIDPTAQGPYALSRGPFLRAADPIWRDAPAPYGPVSVSLSKWAVEASGHDPAISVWLMRALALAGVVMSAVGVAVLARQHRVSQATALAVGLASPLVLIHLLGGSHNDALMLGLTAVGLALFGKDRKVLGAALVIAAVGVKLPAIIALGFLGWNWFGPGTAVARRFVSAASVTAVAAGILGAMSVVVGIGMGWVTALSSTGKVTSTLSPTTKLGFVVSDGLDAIGLSVSSDVTVAAFRLLGLLAALGIISYLLVRSPEQGMVRGIGLSLVALVILGPVIWPWYLPAGFALLAASGLGKWRPTYLVLVIAASFFVWPTSVNPVTSLQSYQHLLGFLAILGIAAAAVVAQHLAVRSGRWRARRDDLRSGVLVRVPAR